MRCGRGVFCVEISEKIVKISDLHERFTKRSGYLLPAGLYDAVFIKEVDAAAEALEDARKAKEKFRRGDGKPYPRSVLLKTGREGWTKVLDQKAFPARISL